ncbi:MAG: patatin family protein [Candidatus Marinimicrobia bacterium]|nr:patatin family protein [Candidatus Neomarinimicrobiota bacterium]
MNLEKTGLVLEGGGLRGVFTSGVLQFLMEKDIYFPYVIGVSMGACNAANYISKQVERNKRVNIEFVNDQRYLSYRRLLLKGELFGMDFIFDTIPNRLVPFDFDTFYNSNQQNWTVVTDCISGQPLYYENKEVGEDYLHILQASASLPFIAKPVHYRGKILMDGGLSDSVPVYKSIEHGNKKNVVILTRPFGYRKSPSNIYKLAGFRFPHYKGLQYCLKNRWRVYNETMEALEKLEKSGNILVIRPETDLALKRTERNKKALYRGYDLGYKTMKDQYEKLLEFLG